MTRIVRRIRDGRFGFEGASRTLELTRWAFFGALLLLVSCSKKAEPEPAPAEAVAATPPSGASSGASPASVHPEVSGPKASASANAPADIAWDAPSGWTRMPDTNPMRKATFKIPKAAGDADDAELTVTS